jgi:hypothetical protein
LREHDAAASDRIGLAGPFEKQFDNDRGRIRRAYGIPKSIR